LSPEETAKLIKEFGKFARTAFDNCVKRLRDAGLNKKQAKAVCEELHPEESPIESGPIINWPPIDYNPDRTITCTGPLDGLISTLKSIAQALGIADNAVVKSVIGALELINTKEAFKTCFDETPTEIIYRDIIDPLKNQKKTL
jgi:hypothetical protein